MKKTYNQPTIMVVYMKTKALMTASLPVSANDYNSQTQTIGAKGGFSWDDEEIENYDYEF